NYTGKIIKENPDTILIVDAVHLDLAPGEYDILKEEDIMRAGFTTHDTSPKMFMDYLKNRTKADIYMLGIQPKSVSFGENVSDEVKKTLKELTNEMKGVLGCMNHI
ncbi:MAG: hydrogenase maturation protease, partial [Candidatus Omnitrophica bacterium]|nr:hydrogenase maturation protease [Candidatus Omnitrophota bacterium]